MDYTNITLTERVVNSVFSDERERLSYPSRRRRKFLSLVLFNSLYLEIQVSQGYEGGMRFVKNTMGKTKYLIKF